MKHTFFNSKVLFFLVLTLLGGGGGYIPLAFAQPEGPEPNNPCTSAQDFGTVGFPFTVEGNLNSSVIPDVDFFKFTGTPGHSVSVDLVGQTLGNPLLGFFNSTCNLFYANDDFNGSNSRLLLTVPDDGIFILAATSYPDFGFIGVGFGTYQMTIRTFDGVVTVNGRVVNSVTGLPLPGDSDPFASVSLLRCVDSVCNDVVNEFKADSLGQFNFTADFIGQPLEEGTYQVIASADQYQPGQTDTFVVASGEDRNVGDISLHPPVFIGSISGQVVDAVTGNPLPGNTEPSSFVILHQCQPGGCPQWNAIIPDNEGRFQFTSDFSGNRLQTGTYFLEVVADQYNSQGTGVFDVTQEGENRDVGDILLQSFPVRFTNKAPCKKVPTKGGSCKYKVRITNGLSTPLNGDSWSIVNSSGIGSLYNETQFQPNTTERLTLKAGESKDVNFAFPLPNTVSDGASICADAYVGRRPVAFWDTVGKTNIFCLTKGAIGFSLMSEREVHKMRGRTFMPQKGR